MSCFLSIFIISGLGCRPIELIELYLNECGLQLKLLFIHMIAIIVETHINSLIK